ncbi:hypothetical protein CAPTEDRAFT_199617 [Capitella teleta]|uniref:Uncharacterized protein n=1 Tax=Capitella teleta TaxID=283909 RepID=R7U8D5_CAPTE|nr:hypothetical protein CAPTEDRAFT_199617 [Capitella teleta]|eukprot:ELU02645.1 hypothetical protein CAPTEDRAFT_199617 [Capitella teleta]
MAVDLKIKHQLGGGTGRRSPRYRQRLRNAHYHNFQDGLKAYSHKDHDHGEAQEQKGVQQECVNCNQEETLVLTTLGGSTPSLPAHNLASELSDIYLPDEKITKKLKNIIPAKSPGPDEVHSRILKKMAQELTKPVYDPLQHFIDNRQSPQYLEASQHHSYTFKKDHMLRVSSSVPLHPI